MYSFPIDVTDHTKRTRWVRGEIRTHLGNKRLERQIERIYEEASAKAFELITGQPPPRLAKRIRGI